jgi:hypothetical protein
MLYNNRDAPELLSIMVGSQSYLSPALANVMRQGKYMEISELIKQSFLSALNAIAQNGEHLEPFSYVIRYGTANILIKKNMPHEQAVEHIKNITRPLDGLSEYAIVWETPYNEHARAIYVEAGSSSEELGFTMVQPFKFQHAGFFSRQNKCITTTCSVMVDWPKSRIHGAQIKDL